MAKEYSGDADMNADKMPEDSTTRRHYETHLKMSGSSGGKAPSPQAAPRPTSSSAPAAKPGGGFMGWLKRLFGG